MQNNRLKIIVTGGAGFIGSCIVRQLNDRGYEDIYVVDHISDTEKWKNLRNKKFIEYIPRDSFLGMVESGKMDDVSAVIHLGACSSTTEKNFDYLWTNNVLFSKAVWNFCCKIEAQFIYASSAATYGDGNRGFDDEKDIDDLMPLNGYGYSKQLFDQWTLKQTDRPVQTVGLKFFNVFGPNEYYKGSMASMVFHGFNQIIADGEMRLFKSNNPDYVDGGQLRDFIYVKDVCKVILFFLDHPDKSGIFNVGTGLPHSFSELAKAVFSALDHKININYIDMPQQLRSKYQYYTCATLEKLFAAGYCDGFMSFENAVKDYVCNYLSCDYMNY